MDMKSRKLLSMPVISLENGQQLGRVKEIILDPSQLALVGLIIDQKRVFKEPRVISFEQIKNIGSHAITVEKASAVEKASSLPVLNKLIKNPIPLIGSKVITEDGTILGIVEEFNFDIQTGAITMLEISGRLLESLFKGRSTLGREAVITLGTDALVIRPQSEEELGQVEGVVQEALANLKEKSSQALTKTMENTRRWTRNISSSLEKAVKKDDNPVDTSPEPPAGDNPELTESPPPGSSE
jgi:uncharacterized protein YrrD